MQLFIKYFDDEITKIEKLAKGDWIDLRAAEDVEMKAGEFRYLRLGVGMILPPRAAALSKTSGSS